MFRVDEIVKVAVAAATAAFAKLARKSILTVAFLFADSAK